MAPGVPRTTTSCCLSRRSPGSSAPSSATLCAKQTPNALWSHDWVVHCQPVGQGWHALKYLAPYIFRVAIGNKRILKLASGKVTFRYRTTDTGKLKRCTLHAQEFIRRFLQHILPRGFVKVRYYGFLCSGLRQRLAALRQQLHALCPDPSPAQVDLAT